MPFNAAARRDRATKQQRDASGHFIPLKPKVKLSGQSDLLSNLIHTEKEKDDSSLINVKVNNPFEKIIRYLKDIRDKQNTTVSMKFTIPLVALPVAILLAFQLGRYQSQCVNYFSSQTGTIENINIVRKVAPDNWVLKLLGYLPGLGEVYLKAELLNQPILIVSPERSILIDNKTKSTLEGFSKNQVIVSGDYNSCSQTLTLDSAENISKL